MSLRNGRTRGVATSSHVILSVWKMAGMDGIELCRRTRAALSPGQYTQFIFITAQTDKEQFLKGMETAPITTSRSLSNSTSLGCACAPQPCGTRA